jgi:DNA polymerase III delta subunit
MLTLIYGTDARKRHQAREQLLEKNPGVTFGVRTTTDARLADLELIADGASLFDEKLGMILEYPFDNENFGEDLIGYLPRLVASTNTIIVLERELVKDIVRSFEKAGADVVLCDEPKTLAKKEFNIFSLTDAFMSRDKKAMWLLYREAVIREHAPEEIIGILFWAIKNMLLLSGTTGSGGLSPFVVTKARSGLTHWKESELAEASRALLHITYGAHSGMFEGEEELERFLIRTV